VKLSAEMASKAASTVKVQKHVIKVTAPLAQTPEVGKPQIVSDDERSDDDDVQPEQQDKRSAQGDGKRKHIEDDDSDTTDDEAAHTDAKQAKEPSLTEEPQSATDAAPTTGKRPYGSGPSTSKRPRQLAAKPTKAAPVAAFTPEQQRAEAKEHATTGFCMLTQKQRAHLIDKYETIEKQTTEFMNDTDDYTTKSLFLSRLISVQTLLHELRVAHYLLANE
jgi:hypothetical protein